MAYWSDKVASALQGGLPRLREFTTQRDADADTYRRALAASAGLSADEIRERVAEVQSPGALPSEEHGRSAVSRAAAVRPDLMPVINGEFAHIALSLVDVE